MHRGVVSRPPIPKELYSNIPEPAPDYIEDEDDANFPPPPPPLTAEELSAAVSAAHEASHQNEVTVSVDGPNSASHINSEDSGLIHPKPLHNPCLESRERQALHKELLLNHRLGKDVLQKPELNKVLRERKATQKKKEWEEHHNSKGRTSLELKLEERANRMKEEEEKKMNIINEEAQAPELVRMHRKITLKPDRNASIQS